MSSSFSTPLSILKRPLMKEEPRNWAELPSELMSSILLRLSVAEILDNAQKVCRPWRQVCKDPFMWRKIDMTNHGNHVNLDLPTICRHADDPSQGGLVEINTGTFINDVLLRYITADRKLRNNGKLMCRHAVDRSQGGLVEIYTGNFVDDDLLGYIAHRSRNLRSLGLGMTCQRSTTSTGIVNAVAKLPLLETIEVSARLCLILDLKAIGHACPQLKTLKINNRCYEPVGVRALRHLRNLSKRVNDYPFHMTFVDSD
ncbi:PREDICTED: putative F-box/LRR-repeat protein 21 [Camelina sativa]|uniref:F-box/LRR-repeat protein 21 n=1 Tax=Camelina sativa TaxID=90675 RepID=A0ABM0Z7K3_CAMSA|nr:PREDICTED: putative F-box/LRR-repeat protein 21 [Camelina sativa]XP_010511532.1 PREDICTED: putative F-box/LRR-repeat protein 21 [Camelina sativa]